MAAGGIGRTEIESKSNIRHSSLYSRHSQASQETIIASKTAAVDLRNIVESVSVEIFTIMTRLGYGEVIRRWRAEKYKENDRLANARCAGSEVAIITVGSKAEGLTCCFESDWDALIKHENVLCVEAGIPIHGITDEIEVYRMDTRVYPGHCILILEIPAHKRKIHIQNALCYDGHGNILLSSGLFVDEYAKLKVRNLKNSVTVVCHERSGPSIPETIRGFIHLDTVHALPCHCPSILHRWASRSRHWPSSVIVQKVVYLGAYLTPVGFKGSENNHMEWRICFNTGESELVKHLNETQANVYIMLKMILKDILKPNKKEITSYVLKNIILWQAENNPQTEFHARNLLHWLHHGLRELRTIIEKKQLCYYMIQERNLMATCGLEDALQRKWVADITDMLEEGPMVILRLPKIRKAIVASPEPMIWFSKRRMEFEMLYLELMNRHVQCKDENGVVDDSDIIWKAIGIRMDEIWVEMDQRMHQEGSSVINQLLSMCDILK